MNARNYTVQTRIERPMAEVFTAMVDAEQLCRYFTERSSGPLVEGQQITWHWSQWGDFPVIVKQIDEPRLIHLQIDAQAWKKTEGGGYPVNIYLELESLEGGGTLLSISEQGWPIDRDGLKASHENCSGWTHMAMCLKAFLEHGLDLR